MDDVQVKRAIQSAGERTCMGYVKVKDEQFRVIEDVVRGWDTFVSLPCNRIWQVSLLRRSAMGIYLTTNRFERYEASPSLAIAPKTHRPKNDATANPQSPSESSSSSSSSESSDLDACKKKKFKWRERTYYSRSASSTPLLPSLPCPYPLEARSQEG